MLSCCSSSKQRQIPKKQPYIPAQKITLKLSNEIILTHEPDKGWKCSHASHPKRQQQSPKMIKDQSKTQQIKKVKQEQLIYQQQLVKKKLTLNNYQEQYQRIDDQLTKKKAIFQILKYLNLKQDQKLQIFKEKLRFNP